MDTYHHFVNYSPLKKEKKYLENESVTKVLSIIWNKIMAKWETFINVRKKVRFEAGVIGVWKKATPQPLAFV